MRKPIIISIISVISILMFGGPLPAQDVDYVGSTLWAGSYDVEVVDDHAYCAFANGLLVFDITDPANPIAAGRLFLQQGAFLHRSIGFGAGYIYIVNRESTLVVVDVADPVVPFIVAEIELPEDIRDLQALGNYVYIADDESGLQIVDIQNPDDPYIIGSIFSGIAARSIFVESDHAYIVGGWNGGGSFHIIDISDPAGPLLEGECPDHETVMDIYVSGNFAYAATSNDGLRIYDITDRSQPGFVGALEMDGGALNVYVEGDYAYILNHGYYYDYLSIVDIADSENPELSSICRLYGAVENLEVNDNNAYVVSVGYYGQSRFDIIDVTDPINPDRAGFYDTSHSLRRFDVSGHYALMSDPYTGLKVVNTDDLSSPSLVAFYEQAFLEDVFVLGNYAFLSRGQILDISNPEEPALVGDCGVFGRTYVQDTVAYFAYSRDLQIIDVSDLQNPVLMASLEIGQFVEDVYVEGLYAFVACDALGLKIVDISNPADPQIRAQLDLSNPAKGVYVHDGYCYVNFFNYNNPRWGKLFIIDISDPLNPFPVGEYETANDLCAVVVRNNYAYLAEGELGLEILDITDPSEPSSVIIFNTSGYAWDVKLAGDYIYLSNQNSFMILHFDPQTGAAEDIADFPQSFSLSSNYPNPFNASTTIRYDLPVESDVRLEIFDMLGRKVGTLVSGIQPAGRHSAIWNAKGLPSSLYFYRLSAGDYSETGKCILLK